VACRSAWADARRDVKLLSGHLAFVVGLLIRRRVDRLLGRSESDSSLGRRLREFLERSGVVGRKLGQFLAMRFDLLPPAVCEELDRLFDRGEPMPFSTVRTRVEAELGQPLERLFRSFESDPMAVASIAQVHAAVATDGERLAVKVQRDGIADAFGSEIRVLGWIAWLSDALRLTGSLSAVEALDEFAEFTRGELSFDEEGRRADRLRSILGPGASAPKVRWDLTAPRVLTMEQLDGVTLLTICRLHESGRDGEIERLLPKVDLADVVDRMAQECFGQLFDRGFFHGDPNPGNILVNPDGSFAFVDFGIVGELPADDRENLVGYTENLVRGQVLQSARYYLRLCRPTPATRIAKLESELAEILATWRAILVNPDAAIADRHISVWQGKVAGLLRKNHVRMQRNLLLVWRAWVLLDSVAIRLPIAFDLIGTQAKYFNARRVRLALGRFTPNAVREEVIDLGQFIRRRARDAVGRPALAPQAHLTLGPSASKSRRGTGAVLALTMLVLGLAILAAGAPGSLRGHIDSVFAR
jgi:ubiquinone biosynthesis protein